MPSAARRSAGTDACVIVAGWEMSVSTPPRLSASAHQPDGVQHAPRRFERSELERQHAAEPAHLPSGQLVLRMRRQPGIVDRADLRMRRQELAPAPGRCRCAAACGAAASWCRAAPATNRTGRGSRLRRSARTSATRCRRRASSMTTPPMLSLWPFRYFVVLCVTRSAPNSIGRWTYGLANVLSTTSREAVPVRQLRGGAQIGQRASSGWSASRRTASASSA